MLSWGQFPSLWGLCRHAEEAHTAPLCRVTQVCVCVKPFLSIALCFSPLSLHRGPQEPEARREQPPGLSLGGSCLKRGCNLGLPVPELLAFLPPSQGKTMQALPYPTSAPLPQQAGRSQINTRLPDSDPSPMVLCETCINITRSTRVGFPSP